MIFTRLSSTIRTIGPKFSNFTTLIHDNFAYYSDLTKFFYGNISRVSIDEAGKKDFFSELRQKLFEQKHFENINSILESFRHANFELGKLDGDYQEIKEIIKLLKTVNQDIIKIIEIHSEFHRFRKDSLTDKEICDFVLEIDRIGVEWDFCLSKYRSMLSIVRQVENSSGGVQAIQPASFGISLPRDYSISTDLVSKTVEFVENINQFVDSLISGEKSIAEKPSVDFIEVKNGIFISFHCKPALQSGVKNLIDLMLGIDFRIEPLFMAILEQLNNNFGKKKKTASAGKGKGAKKKELTLEEKLYHFLNSLPEGSTLVKNDTDGKSHVAIFNDLWLSIDKQKSYSGEVNKQRSNTNNQISSSLSTGRPEVSGKAAGVETNSVESDSVKDSGSGSIHFSGAKAEENSHDENPDGSDAPKVEDRKKRSENLSFFGGN